MSEDDDLPKLTAYTLTGQATFTVEHLVRVDVQETADNIGVYQQELLTSGVVPVTIIRSGGGRYLALYKPEDVHKISGLLRKLGAAQRYL